MSREGDADGYFDTEDISLLRFTVHISLPLLVKSDVRTIEQKVQTSTDLYNLLYHKSLSLPIIIDIKIMQQCFSILLQSSESINCC